MVAGIGGAVRGLTAEEYDVLRFAASNPGDGEVFPHWMMPSVHRLGCRGLLYEWECEPGARASDLTPAGREAMRIYESIQVLEGVR